MADIPKVIKRKTKGGNLSSSLSMIRRYQLVLQFRRILEKTCVFWWIYQKLEMGTQMKEICHVVYQWSSNLTSYYNSERWRKHNFFSWIYKKLEKRDTKCGETCRVVNQCSKDLLSSRIMGNDINFMKILRENLEIIQVRLKLTLKILSNMWLIQQDYM